MPSHPFDLSGKVALVTGGSKGLGKAMAAGLAAAGADVFISSRTEADLKAAVPDIQGATGRRVEYATADSADRAAMDTLAKTVLDKMGRIDILVNNAGTNAPEPIDAVTDETWDRVLEVNLSSVMALTRAVVPQMKERKWGRIIHVSSIFGVVSKEKRNIYSATKAALHGLAKASAIDLGPFGITVNCIAPGPFLTDLPMSLLSEAEKKAFADHTCVGRWGQPSELAGPCLFLASDAGSYVTGHVLLVDGGYTAR